MFLRAENRCIKKGYPTPPYMSVAEPGSLYSLITIPYLPPAASPFPILTEDDVIEPPLPPVIAKALSPGPGPGPGPTYATTNSSSPPQNNAQLPLPPVFFVSGMTILFATLLML